MEILSVLITRPVKRRIPGETLAKRNFECYLQILESCTRMKHFKVLRMLVHLWGTAVYKKLLLTKSDADADMKKGFTGKSHIGPNPKGDAKDTLARTHPLPTATGNYCEP